MGDKEYFSLLYEIARHLNQEFSLQAALRKALERTVNLMNLETGWIWLVRNDNKSVHLAASHNLPPALTNYPERLSGWCYCIEKYLSNDFSEARNISEITCTRLKDIRTETRDLKFHATVPIFVKGEKTGLLNLVSKETQQLNDKQLSILNTISELISIAIQRTRLQETYGTKRTARNNTIQEILERILQPRLETLLTNLNALKSLIHQPETASTLDHIAKSVELAKEMKEQLLLVASEFGGEASEKISTGSFHYPGSQLTNRELEVLALVKKGHTNKQIAEQLFIAERTVKFHISSILSKFAAKTRTEAVDMALRKGLLDF